MNERIAELALRAYNSTGQPPVECLDNFMQLYSEKFAGLIVKECANVCENYAWGVYNT